MMRLPPTGRLLAAYDLDANRILLPDHVQRMSAKRRQAWLTDHGLVPAVGGGTGYSWVQMQEPFQLNDALAVTAAAETVLTQDTFFTLPANFFSYPGKSVWIHAMGKQSNVVTTPGTYTFRLRYNTVSGPVLAASGAIVPNPVAVTDNLWFVDFYLKALATGQTSTSLTLLTHGRVYMANADASLASTQAAGLPGGGTSLASVTALDGTIARALTLTVTPTVATGSITARDCWIVALN